MIKFILDYWYIWLPFVIVGLGIFLGWWCTRGDDMADMFVSEITSHEDESNPALDWMNNPANPANPTSPLNPVNPASPLNMTNNH
jgi:hypothetical protein